MNNKPVRSKMDFDQNKAIMNINKKVKALADQTEVKVSDTQILSTAAPVAGSITLINGILQEDNAESRVGNEVFLTSVQVRYFARMNTANADSQPVRVLLVRDRQANGAVPTFNQMLDLTVITDPVMAPYNRNYAERFKFYHDKTIMLNQSTHETEAAGSVTVYAGNERHVKIKQKLGWKIKFVGTTAGIASIGTNALYMVFCSNTSSDAPLYDFGSRVFFKDA